MLRSTRAESSKAASRANERGGRRWMTLESPLVQSSGLRSEGRVKVQEGDGREQRKWISTLSEAEERAERAGRGIRTSTTLPPYLTLR